VGPDPIERPPRSGSGDGRQNRPTNGQASATSVSHCCLWRSAKLPEHGPASLGVHDQPGIGRHWNTTQRAHDFRCRHGIVAHDPQSAGARVAAPAGFREIIGGGRDQSPNLLDVSSGVMAAPPFRLPIKHIQGTYRRDFTVAQRELGRVAISSSPKPLLDAKDLRLAVLDGQAAHCRRDAFGHSCSAPYPGQMAQRWQAP